MTGKEWPRLYADKRGRTWPQATSQADADATGEYADGLPERHYTEPVLTIRHDDTEHTPDGRCAACDRMRGECNR